MSGAGTPPEVATADRLTHLAEQAVDLRTLLEPESVAVVGASNDALRIGGRLFAQLKDTYQGLLYAVNPTRAVVQGHRAYPSIWELPGPVDLAFILVPGAQLDSVTRDCATVGVKSGVLMGAGFAETGATGARRQTAMARFARDNGMRLVGPNCVGLINLARGLRGTFGSLDGLPTVPGEVAIISQSGAVGLELYEAAQTAGLGLSHLVTTGNECDVTAGDVARYLVHRPEVKALVLFLEAVNAPSQLQWACHEAAELGKPIIAMKVGRSVVGRRAAASHTGSIAIASDVVDAMFERFGVVRVDSRRELIEFAKVFASGRRPRGGRVVIITGSGGLGIDMADEAQNLGLELNTPSAPLRSTLRDLLPSFASSDNPIDYTAQIMNDPAALPMIYRSLFAADEYDSVCVAQVHRMQGEAALSEIAELASLTPKPIVACTNHTEVMFGLMAKGLPTVKDPIDGMRAIAALTRFAKRQGQRPIWPIPEPTVATPSAQNPAALSASESASLLATRGITMITEDRAGSEAEAIVVAERFGYPVAMKLVGDGLEHKSEIGGVVLDIPNQEHVVTTFGQLDELHRSLGPGRRHVVIQEMAPRGIELIAGAFRDPSFGPVVLVGIGGVQVEIVSERRISLYPIDLDGAIRLVASLAGGRLISERRGLKPQAVESVARVLIALGEMLVDDHRISEVDINPLIVTDDGVVAVDSLVIAEKGG